MQKQLRKNLTTGVLGFLIVFGILLALASVFDFEVSQALTGALPAGKYYTENQFALLVECAGYSLIYFFGGLAAVICCVAALNLAEGDRLLWIKEIRGGAQRAVKAVLVMGFGALAVFEFYLVFHEFFDYPDRFLQEELLGSGTTLSIGGGYLTAIQLFCAVASVSTLLMAFRRLNKADLKKLVRFAAVIFVAILFYQIVIEAVKSPAGRVRYRTMNVLGDFSYYTQWYVFSGQRYLSSDLEVIAGSLESANRFLGLSDTFKSFPSGHTYAAAISFAAICLPDLFEGLRTQAVRLLCWLLPAALTVTVAVGRIMAGAHFLSDVLIGGACAFVITVLARELIVLQGAHLKALFGRASK